MRLVTYKAGGPARVGVVEGDWVVDVANGIRALRPSRVRGRSLRAAVATVRAAGDPPRDMIDLLGRGETYRKALGVIAGAVAEEAASSGATKDLLMPLKKVRLRAPILRPPKITCVGLNYADHAREQGVQPPASPIFFLKSANTICGPGDKIQLPPNSRQVDYEAELAVVIGKRGKRIPVEKADQYIAGYTILHDVSARDLQFADQQWFRGKSCDTFAPTGPWILTRDEVPDPHNLRISLTLNGATMQDSSTSNLIFKINYLISYLSQSLTWEVGDLISTGTPPGVGVFRRPPVFLKAGDTVSITVEKLGTLTNPVAAR